MTPLTGPSGVEACSLFPIALRLVVSPSSKTLTSSCPPPSTLVRDVDANGRDGTLKGAHSMSSRFPASQSVVRCPANHETVPGLGRWLLGTARYRVSAFFNPCIFSLIYLFIFFRAASPLTFLCDFLLTFSDN